MAGIGGNLVIWNPPGFVVKPPLISLSCLWTRERLTCRVPISLLKNRVDYTFVQGSDVVKQGRAAK